MSPEPPSRQSTALSQALRELDIILANAGVGIVFVKARRLVRCNQRYAEIYGFDSAEAAVGHSSVELYATAQEARGLGARAYPVLSSGETFRGEQMMRRQSGELFWAHLTGRLINPDDPADGSIWIVDDITERKLADAALADLHAEQQLIFDHAMVGIVFLRGRRVTRCNRAFEQLFGYGPGELDGQLSRAWYLCDADWKAAGDLCYEPLSRGDSYHAEMLLGRKDGTPVWCEVRSKAIDRSDLSRGSIWITQDITARKLADQELVTAKAQLEALVAQRTQQLSQTVAALEQKVAEQQAAEAHIQRLALFDGLTGLPNRHLLADRASQAIDIARRNDEPLAVLFLDLDHFKNVNDSLGHRVGDAMLVQLASRLRGAVREQDTVARTGGDEFVLVLPLTDIAGAAHLATKLMALASAPFQVEQQELTVTPSMGIAMFPTDGDDFDTLCKCADAAMYRAKKDGRNAYRFFTSEMQAQSARALLLENALRRALERKQLSLHYQPQASLDADGETRIVGAEALLRWHHPELGWVSPAEFIPIAESSGLILPIGEWVLREALCQLRAWDEIGLPELTMAVNLSAVQFRHDDLPELVGRLLGEIGMPAGRLELELTEGAAMDDPAMAITVMNELHERGVRLSIDDFGTGYSSLSYLKKFRVSKLKIDQSFVRDLTEDVEDCAIVDAVIRMAAALGLETLAEGVETEGQLAFLRRHGCRAVQGYLFSRPLPADAFAEFVLSRTMVSV
ncbi:putative bifunctional diguanylate cyclase/phosphodiesterase [Roseateles saccharophilus]|uniref:PAS domain S-box-containing protein/diguanylate cyclase (GGDEF)-like protein n=1 Tax=Roseateles saccharophilus TaxID=304 RepID=A0A4R3VKA2_ROSSA|nr:bifunctional diguanylate cyclase/phosphodiesterase [Roseateles saccharophilus]MDG0831158.1 EAL domain-containing protein [Roseateles saccharophilus]TCV04278.1 PAS domain S-box-containing protein/diguanylate cyclase (GGDEF)-like protein [Roseateles saccharophilus]